MLLKLRRLRISNRWYWPTMPFIGPFVYSTPDGFRPHQMIDIIIMVDFIGRKETGHDLLSLVTSFVNLLLSGESPQGSKNSQDFVLEVG